MSKKLEIIEDLCERRKQHLQKHLKEQRSQTVIELLENEKEFAELLLEIINDPGID